MKYQEVISDDSGITIFPDKSNRYRIMWWQIDKDGYGEWVRHLSEKSWFTDGLRKRFVELCKEHNSSVYYN